MTDAALEPTKRTMSEQEWRNEVIRLLGEMAGLAYPVHAVNFNGVIHPAYPEKYINGLLRLRAALLESMPK